MKLCSLRLVLFVAVCVRVVNALSLDREAFTFTHYDLTVRVEPGQQRLGVRGKITLRNDSATPQKIAVLQISSSLNWRSIRAAGKQLQFVSQPFTSDIDHTGALSEAIVTLPEAVAPKGTIDLEIAYEGVIVLDATRLTRLGAPEAAAHNSDWDQISTQFTGVRGAGYVTWYPMASEAADLAEGKNLFEIVARWKAREAGSKMHINVTMLKDDGERPPALVVNEPSCSAISEAVGRAQKVSADCTYQSLGLVVPTFVMASYEDLDRPDIEVHYLTGHNVSAATYAGSAEQVIPFTTEWFGAPRSKAKTVDLADPDAAPFESGPLLLTPLTSTDSKLAALAAAHQLTHAAFFSPRPWINEGLAHFAQALYLEHVYGRQSALDYMALHRSALNGAESEKQKQTTAPRSEDEVNRSLINTSDEELYRSKAMCVWWMLRDMIGDQSLKKAFAAYHPEQDTEPSYMQHLIQAQTQRDLGWFFDDWVYRDRGLPDFKVASAFSRKTSPEVYLVTITAENLGAAGAELPITIMFEGGVIVKKIVVRGKSNTVIRVEVPKPPEEIVVNDGSVPESDTTNNVFKIEGDASK
jgi:Peptidase family M1 domain